MKNTPGNIISNLKESLKNIFAFSSQTHSPHIIANFAYVLNDTSMMLVDNIQYIGILLEQEILSQEKLLGPN